MKTRLITAFIGAILFFVVLFSPPIVFQSGVIIVTGIAIYEAYAATGILKKVPLAITGCFGALLCALLGCMHLGKQAVGADICLLCMALHAGALLALMVFRHETVKLSDASVAFFMAVIIGLLYSFLIPIREGDVGIYNVLIVFAGTWCADGGAYFIGVRFGKTKLAPKLSPKKTVEGAFGGVLGSVVAMLILSFVISVIMKVQINFIGLLLTGLGCAVLGPVADIATSAIKREFGIKDFGNLFPGHGGVLDRFDSILLTAPFVYYMQQWFSLVG